MFTAACTSSSRCTGCLARDEPWVEGFGPFGSIPTPQPTIVNVNTQYFGSRVLALGIPVLALTGSAVRSLGFRVQRALRSKCRDAECENKVCLGYLKQRLSIVPRICGLRMR